MQALDLVETKAASPAAALSPEDEAALREAVAALERMTFAGRLTEMVGRQIDFAGKLVPQPISGAVGKAVTLALKAALRVALTSLSRRTETPSPARDRRVWSCDLAGRAARLDDVDPAFSRRDRA